MTLSAGDQVKSRTKTRPPHVAQARRTTSTRSGTEKVGADSSRLVAAVNLARLGNLGASSISAGWTVAEP
jgi:hypothetical protein